MAEGKGLLLYNALIYTLDKRMPIASAILIQADRIKALAQDDDLIDDLTGVKQVDLGGHTVIPGLIDAHIHLDYYALSLQKVNCETNSKDECLRRVAQRVGALPVDEWVLGHGWNQNNWEDGFGSLADLDAIAPNHPVYLTAKSLHAAWANSVALKQAKISAATPDPAGGRIGRSSNGEPDGLLFEGAMELVADVIPEPKTDELAQAIHRAQTHLFSLGLTGVHDFDRRRCFSALQCLHQEEKLHLRVLKNIPVEDLHHAVSLGLRFGFGDLLLRIGGVKIFSDGALGPGTAAMLQPYEGQPDNRGMLLMDAEEILEHGIMAADSGLPLTIHAIGDAANHEVLNAYTQLRAYEAVRSREDRILLRHRIEHVQLLNPRDVARLAELNVIASMQPIHATSDMYMADKLWGSRSSLAYAFQTQLQQGLEKSIPYFSTLLD